jgi:phosphatidylserine/phosphatidylglycerophosphate/cardiolipin synthase-like enzyme
MYSYPEQDKGRKYCTMSIDISIYRADKQWWATGDTPLREGSRVTYFIDGRATFLEMCRHFMRAQHSIYLANWGLEPNFLLVRGRDQVPSSEDHAAYQAYISALQSAGLKQADIDFWLQNEMTIKNVLSYAVQKGVEVKVLLWKVKKAFSVYDSQLAHDELTAAGIPCLLDDSAEGILHHPIEALHQKVTVVDSAYAFVGGLDPLIEKEDDFDRWDTSDHLYTTSLRRTKQGKTPHPWHDVHTLIEGPAAGDVERNFRQRWNDVIEHHHKDKSFLIPERPLPTPVESNSLVQIARTVPVHTYSFDKHAIKGITQFYDHAFTNAKHTIYLENQYFWLHAYYGIDLPFLSTDSPEMEQHLQQLSAALERGAALSIILPDHPNVGRAFSDAGLTELRNRAPQADAEGRIQAFCLATSAFLDQHTHYRPIYVHAKVAIIDDQWFTVGSANLNNRGMSDDTEINVAVLNPEQAHGLRLLLQAEHLGLVTADDIDRTARLLCHKNSSEHDEQRAQNTLSYLEQTLGDPIQALELMRQRAEDNLARYKANQPLIGHLLPYLTAQDALKQGLNFREGHGWLEEEEH